MPPLSGFKRTLRSATANISRKEPQVKTKKRRVDSEEVSSDVKRARVEEKQDENEGEEESDGDVVEEPDQVGAVDDDGDFLPEAVDDEGGEKYEEKDEEELVEDAKARSKLPKDERPDCLLDEKLDEDTLSKANTIPDYVFEQIKTPVKSKTPTKNAKRFDRRYRHAARALMSDGAVEKGPVKLFAQSTRRWLRWDCVKNSKERLIDLALSSYPAEHKEIIGAESWSKADFIELADKIDVDECCGTYTLLGVESDDLAELEKVDLQDFELSILTDYELVDLYDYKGQTSVSFVQRRGEHRGFLRKDHASILKSRAKPNGRCLSAYVDLTLPNVGVLFCPAAKLFPVSEPGLVRYHLAHLLFIMETIDMILTKTWMPPLDAGLDAAEIYAKYRPSDMPDPISTKALNRALPVTQGVRSTLSPKAVRIIKEAAEKIRRMSKQSNVVAPLYREYATDFKLSYKTFLKHLRQRFPSLIPLRTWQPVDKDELCQNEQCGMPIHREGIVGGVNNGPKGVDGKRLRLCSPCGGRWRAANKPELAVDKRWMKPPDREENPEATQRRQRYVRQLEMQGVNKQQTRQKQLMPWTEAFTSLHHMLLSMEKSWKSRAEQKHGLDGDTAEARG